MPIHPTARSPFAALLAVGVLALGGCGSSDDERTTAEPAPSVAGSAPAFGTPQRVAMSDTEHDRFLGAAFDGSNRLYASGWVGTGADQLMAVSRFGADGAVDRTFGTNGVATVNVAVGGKAVELARGVVVQSNGKVVVAGPVEHDPAATGDPAKDTDIAVARFTAEGQIDPSFGPTGNGVVRLDLSTGAAEGTAYRGDTSWGLTGLADGKLLVVGAEIAPGKTELDFAVVRLTAEGAWDTTFATNGVAIVGTQPGVSETPRAAVELPGGAVVVSGYAGIGSVVQTVLFKLTPAGALDPTFGTAGVATASLLGNVTEAYAVGVLGNGRLVTTGYGKDTAEAKVDLIVGGFTAAGAVDRAHGTNGVVRLDIAGDDDRGRHLVSLPNGGALVVGSGKPTATNIDAMVVKLTPAGALDTTFGTGGRQLYDLGGPNDSFFGAAVSADRSRVAVVGYLGRETTGTDKDDAVVLWLQP